MSDDKNRFAELIVPGQLGQNDPARQNNERPLREGLDDYSNNIYYYWHQYFKAWLELRDSNEYKSFWPRHPSERNLSEVSREFDVQQDEDFRAWWQRKGQWLFSEKYETESRAERIELPLGGRTFDGGIGIFFPLDGNLKDMLSDAERILKEAQSEFRRSRDDLRSDYKIHSKRYEIASLHNKLVIFKAVIFTTKRKTFASIFCDINKDLFLPRPLNQMSPDLINEFMSDNFDGACRLVYHVAAGEFPKFDKPKEHYNPRKHPAR